MYAVWQHFVWTKWPPLWVKLCMSFLFTCLFVKGRQQNFHFRDYEVLLYLLLLHYNYSRNGTYIVSYFFLCVDMCKHNNTCSIVQNVTVLNETWERDTETEREIVLLDRDFWKIACSYNLLCQYIYISIDTDQNNTDTSSNTSTLWNDCDDTNVKERQTETI